MLFLLACALASAPPPPEKPVSEDKPAAQGVTRVEYHFGDSSVPPPYHRSYTIAVSAQTVSKVVDSYGDIVEQSERPGSAEDLQKAVAAFEAAKIMSGPKTEDEGCTGGTTDTVRLFTEEGQSFVATVYWCGGEGYGTLRGDVKAFKAAMNELAK